MNISAAGLAWRKPWMSARGVLMSKAWPLSMELTREIEPFWASSVKSGLMNQKTSHTVSWGETKRAEVFT
ncbi:hypothetical protein CQ018_18140 [Arthrobacter sp. MYb227]|nr:hypothetical protein CQ018_18140 [Arthrobacter sp. MYb227]